MLVDISLDEMLSLNGWMNKALAIDGWMSVEELAWLGNQASKHSIAVEIGSYLGRSTYAIGSTIKERVYAIDNWYGPTDSWVYLTDETRKILFDQFKTNLKDLINSRKVFPIKMDHRKIELNVKPDFVFIDGDHSTRAVLDDINTWLPRTKEGGLICGHDIQLETVHTAVKQRFPKFYQPTGTNIWVFEVEKQ